MLMSRFTLILASLQCVVVVNTTAQSNSTIGLWEATVKPDEHVDHHVLYLSEDGSYEYTILSNNPDDPLRSDAGTFHQIDGMIALTSSDGMQIADTLSVNSDDTSLLNRGLSVSLQRGREFDGNIHGTWEFLGSDGQPTGYTFTAFQDGTFEADVSTGTEKGWFVIAGSAMVHFPTEASNPRLLGVPGLWTNVTVESDVLSYTIANTKIVITGRRVITTSIQSTTWARVKSSIMELPAHNDR